MMGTECWERLDEVEKLKVILGTDMDEEETTYYMSIKRYLRKVMHKRRNLRNG